MRILDLFCGEGGAAEGYSHAGFDVIGIDTSRAHLRRYPFECHQLEWRAGLERFAGDVDAIHASPPCQRYSQATSPCNRGSHPDLVGPVRDALRAAGLPYVIENVPGSPLVPDVILCGSMFGLTITTRGQVFGLVRHRLFETTFPVRQPECRHRYPAMPVLTTGPPSKWRERWGFDTSADEKRSLMRTPWMTSAGCGESIPPAYAEFIGQHLSANLLCEAA